MSEHENDVEVGAADVHMPSFRRLPEALKVCGIYFNPTQMKAQMQYENNGVIYELSFPIEEIMKSEDWFIELRKHLGAAMNQRKANRQDKPKR